MYNASKPPMKNMNIIFIGAGGAIFLVFIIGLIVVCCAKRSRRCNHCSHDKHSGRCHGKLYCSSCGHYHGRHCNKSKKKTYNVSEDVNVPIEEEYTVLENVKKYKTEKRIAEKQVPRQIPHTNQVLKTRRVPVTRYHQVQYTDFETRTTQQQCPYYGACGYTTWSTETVPVVKYKSESYEDYVDETYYENETTYTYEYDIIQVEETVQIPYTVKENVQKKRVVGHKTEKRNVEKVKTIPCDCKYDNTCLCNVIPWEIFIFSICAEDDTDKHVGCWCV